MAQQMSLKSRAFTASAVAPRASTRCVAVRAANKEVCVLHVVVVAVAPTGALGHICLVLLQAQPSLVDRVAPSMLAALVTLSTGFTTFDASFAPPARADEEEVRGWG